jgi:hypothetical protein
MDTFWRRASPLHRTVGGYVRVFGDAAPATFGLLAGVALAVCPDADLVRRVFRVRCPRERVVA